ncbi:NAD(P)-dependent oxidoreductase [Pelagibacterium sp. 26DY04]|uniref:NAD-dependent epimerase/dehydratase family protein n=1 Tax=Pelagibacterium sp. 26DY04 TaxID=2967130 RepID=UPI002814EDA7|nr:NAD(P)-dependent oxidoreductase [Pelagibacterium sp. 26DY04]WMT85942.1 NAD(P)-dependent oxidoreductase [Pelagibacterium sp. 26DY04]
MKRLLITGAAGSLGKVARARLTHLAETLRLSDISDLGSAKPGEELVSCDLADSDAVSALVEDCDGILHLGGISTEQSFEAILNANIIGLRNLYEAARAHGQPRIFFAGSNHVIGFYRQQEPIDHNSPVRPDGMYGVSKCFGEALARFYFDKFGQETAIVRIGSCFEKPTDYRMLATWLSYGDFVSLVERVFEVPNLGCPTIWGVSANSRRWWSNDHVRYLGWSPKDSADAYAEDIQSAGNWPNASHPLSMFQGGNNTQDPLT